MTGSPPLPETGNSRLVSAMELHQAQHWHEFSNQSLDVVQAVGHVVSLHVILVEILVRGTGRVKQAADVAIPGFRSESADDPVVMPVAVAFPPVLRGDGIQDLCGSAPTLFGCLRQIAGGQNSAGNLGWLCRDILRAS